MPDDGNYTVLHDGVPIMDEVSLNMTKLYYYENFNVTTMNQPTRYRKLIISLEPCEGVVYLFVRKTRRCWPEPHSCCKPRSGSAATYNTAPPCNTALHSMDCGWTHFRSIIDGSKDGAPTFFEVPLTSTKYYIAVFAPHEPNMLSYVSRPRFRFMALADIGAYPRPGQKGSLQAKQVSEMAVELSWEAASFVPLGISSLQHYYVYSSLLLTQDAKVNEAVFINPSKVMNAVCGLEKNAVRYGAPLTSSSCQNGVCSATIVGIVPRRRYMLNIISDSYRGYNSTYSGIIVTTDWTETTQVWGDSVLSLIGAICGTVFGVVVIGYLWIVKLYH